LCSCTQVDGSPYGNHAYCEEFPRSSSQAYADMLAAAGGNTTTTAMSLQYWAQVGKPDVPRSNFDDIFQAFVTVFQVQDAATLPLYSMTFITNIIVLNY
jgi:hypothetical protein